MFSQRSFERVDRLGQAIGPLVAPSQGQGNAGIGGTQTRRDFQGPECLPIVFQVRRLPLSRSSPRTACSASPAGFRGSGAIAGQVEHQIAFGLVKLLPDPIVADPTHLNVASHDGRHRTGKRGNPATNADRPKSAARPTGLLLNPTPAPKLPHLPMESLLNDAGREKMRWPTRSARA